MVRSDAMADETPERPEPPAGMRYDESGELVAKLPWHAPKRRTLSTLSDATFNTGADPDGDAHSS